MGAAGRHAGPAQAPVTEGTPADTSDGRARLRKRSVTVAGHRTSLSLECAFWDALKDLAVERRCSVSALIAEIDARRTGNLSSAVRVWVLEEVNGRSRTRC